MNKDLQKAAKINVILSYPLEKNYLPCKTSQREYE